MISKIAFTESSGEISEFENFLWEKKKKSVKL